MAGHTAGIGPQITSAMGQMSGQIGQAVSDAMANQLPLPPPMFAGPPVMTSAIPTATVVLATAAPVTPPAEQLTTLTTALSATMGQSARELSQLLRGALQDYFVQAT